MPISLLGAIARHERRVRLLFDAPLAPAALSVLSLYAIRSPAGVAVPLSGIVLIAGERQALELALGVDLDEGIVFTVLAPGVPAADGSVTAQDTSARVALGQLVAAPSASNPGAPGLDELLYGVDLVWTGTDYAEGPDGDLDTVSGAANVEAALGRRVASDGLPWDSTYGARPRAYVDGSPGAASTLKGALLQQLRADDRVKTATATLFVEDDQASFELTASLIGADKVALTVDPNASR